MKIAPLFVFFGAVASATVYLICPKCQETISASDCNGKDGPQRANVGLVWCHKSKPGQKVPTQCGIMDSKDEKKAKTTINPGEKGSSGILGTGDKFTCKASGESFENVCLEVVDKSDKSLLKVCATVCTADAAVDVWHLSEDKKFGIKCGNFPSFIPAYCLLNGHYQGFEITDETVQPGKSVYGEFGHYSFKLTCKPDLAMMSLMPGIIRV